MSSSNPISRLWQIRRIVKKHGLTDLLDELELTGGAKLAIKVVFGRPIDTASPRGQRIRLALESLGPVFIKLGQALSTRPDLLPADIAQELSKLQDQVPPFSGEEALQIIHASFGDEIQRIFKHIEPQPMASASVAQVHAATLNPGLALQGKNGEASDQVVIKVLRPGVETQIKKDLRLMYTVAKSLQKYWRHSAQFKPLKIIREFETTILGELDLRQEAANCSQMGANFANTDIIYVPIVYWDYTQPGIMVMERIYGTSVRDVDKLKELGYDLKQLASDGVTTFFKQAFEDNFFHADMHPGNIFVSEKGKWIAIDFGIMGVLNESDKRYLAEMLLGFFNRDYRSIAESHLRAGWIPADTQLGEFETAVRMVCEPNFAKPIAEISFGKVLMGLITTVQRFEMPVQPQLVLLYKTLLQIEGLGRQLYPQLNLWDTAKPFLETWMKQQLSPQALINGIKRDWPQWQAILADLPNHLQRLQSESEQKARSQGSKTNQDQPRPRRRLHMMAGYTAALFAMGMLSAAHIGLLQPSLISDWSPFVGIIGLFWAFINSR